ncbi:AAA family ATPase [Burkholderia cenocepacia]|nr:AAA family ATPase [Burkholderia cenocepacia]RQV30896.1 AAA family ATPase [Burkholderia cenocepacia]RQV76632.1 AAA family ATPase [Burkholderia cenocepacia]RQV91830.1 AAA family ATPase [Burkholderia cenocepacia]
MNRPSLSFRRIEINNWRQFSSIDIEFHERLTVITGANGAGKSTILGVLAQHFGWQRQYLSTPRRPKGSTSYSYVTGLWNTRRTSQPSIHPFGDAEIVGNISYSEGPRAELYVPKQTGSVQYQLNIHQQQSIKGVSIGSHRPLPVYQQVANIPTNAIRPDAAYQSYFSEQIQRYMGSYTQFSPAYRLKEALISMATFGAGNEYVQGDTTVLNAFLGFQRILKIVLPPSIGFEKISIRTPDVVLVTKSGEFLIDAASGGVMSLIDLAWQIHLYSLSNTDSETSFSVILDEPENHLHPSMQRSLMAGLLAAFPHVQFIVATHSPFVVSSVSDSYVYVLRYHQETSNREDKSESDEAQDGTVKVGSVKLDNVNRAGTASEILRDVLGVPATIPEWVETKVKEVVSTFKERTLDNHALADLRVQMNAIGCGEFYPQAISVLFEGK